MLYLGSIPNTSSTQDNTGTMDEAKIKEFITEYIRSYGQIGYSLKSVDCGWDDYLEIRNDGHFIKEIERADEIIGIKVKDKQKEAILESLSKGNFYIIKESLDRWGEAFKIHSEREIIEDDNLDDDDVENYLKDKGEAK